MARRAQIGRVPYKKMARAVELKKKEHPDAADVKPIWSNGRILVEVWGHDGRARIELVFEDDEEDRR